MAWGNQQFIEHYYMGGGAAKTLSEIDLIGAVKKFASEEAIDRKGGFKDSVFDKAKEVKQGLLHEYFERSYDFSGIVDAMGGGVLRATYEGTCENWEGHHVTFDGNILVAYTDTFEDPLDIIEKLYGSSSSPTAPDWLKKLANVGGTPYKITDTWILNFGGLVLLV